MTDAGLVPDALPRLPLVPVGLAFITIPQSFPSTARLTITTNLLVPPLPAVVLELRHVVLVLLLDSQFLALPQIIDHELARLLRQSFLRPGLGEFDALSGDPGRLVGVVELVDGRSYHQGGEPASRRTVSSLLDGVRAKVHE